MSLNPVYNQLQEDKLNGRFESFHVIGLPRSNGTALHQALVQAPEATGQINEAWNYHDLKGRDWDFVPSSGEVVRTFEDGCSFVMDHYQRFVSQTEKVKLVLHDLSYHITLEEFKQFQQLDSHIVFAIRNPLQHALSLLTRYVNDKISQPGGNKLNSQEALEFLDDNTDVVDYCEKIQGKIDLNLIRQLTGKEVNEEMDHEDYVEAREKILEMLMHGYSACWNNLYQFFTMASNEESSSTCPYTVFDSACLFNEPELHLNMLAERINGLSYTPQMVSGWTKGTGDDFNCVITRNWGDFAKINAWNGPARNSTGITFHKGSVKKSPKLHQFPEKFQSLIVKVTEFYLEMKKSPFAITS